jgi:hypothetical protein
LTGSSEVNVPESEKQSGGNMQYPALGKLTIIFAPPGIDRLAVDGLSMLLGDQA